MENFNFMMNFLSKLVYIYDLASVVIAIIALVFSIIIYIHGLNRESSMLTIENLEKIRMKYRNSINFNEAKKKDYLTELEFFSTGVNQKIYSLKIVNKMCGGRLVYQYNKWIKNYIDEYRNKKVSTVAYIEYEKMINKLIRIRDRHNVV